MDQIQNNGTMKIACAIPPVSKGSGGIRTILTNVSKLAQYYNCEPDLYIQPYVGMNAETASNDICEFFGLSYKNIFFDETIPSGYDISIASAWNSVDTVLNCDSRYKFYFVQDYEPWFYPMGNEWIQAENTYKEGLNHIVFGRWLSNTIERVSGKPVHTIDFCSDHRIYKPLSDTPRERAVCAIWQPGKPRRMHELLINALRILEKADPTITIYLYGSDESFPLALKNVKVIGNLSVRECNKLYNKCICGISLSGSNPSRIPFEMMTAGLPVIELYRDNNLYDFPDSGCLLCEANPESLAEAVLYLASNPNVCETMGESGISYMSNRFLENESAAFVKGILDTIQNDSIKTEENNIIYHKDVFTAGKETSDIWNQLKKIKGGTRATGSHGISADSILFQYDCSTDREVYEAYTLAVWKEPDQSDLEWLTFEKNSNGLLEYLWTIPDTLTEPGKYNLHLYGRNEKMNLLLAIDRNFIKDKEGGETKKINLVANASQSQPVYSDRDLRKARSKNKKRKKKALGNIVLLDTYMDSQNIGDCVIMDACNEICAEVLPGSEFRHVSTHVYRKELEDLCGLPKILCGTNILYRRMEDQKQWQFPNSIFSFNNITLLGVGMNDLNIEDGASEYTAELFKAILTPNAVHSVRDSLAEKALKDMGIPNVVNTACPTMWSLTPEKLKNVPEKKGKAVITSVTDYNVDLEADRFMLETLKEEYEEVYIWIQGSQDINLCLDRIVNLDDYKLIDSSIENLNSVLQRDDIDYIGTRLHAGIRALNTGRRTLVISIDNRARQIGKDTGFPVMERKDLYTHLKEYIHSESVIDVHLPWDNIELWKNQWK